jgi:glycosyltransferase involved in cell wall biosynthesis
MRFAVVVPAYNAAETLEGAVRSALEQAPRDFEVVISDDGSTDDTLAVARAIAEADRRVRVVTAENTGCAAARNRGFETVTAEFCVPLDADDLLAPECLSAMSAFIDARPGFDIYSSNGTRLMPGGRSEPFFSGAEFERETSWTLDDIIVVNQINITSAVRRDLWARVGGFTEGLLYAEDYDFWLRSLALGARHVFTPQRLGIYVNRAGGKSKNRIPHAQAQLGIFTRLAEMPELSEVQRALCAEKLGLLEKRIARLELEGRLQKGEYAGARRDYFGLRSAYNSPAMYAAGMALMLASPRLYTSVFGARAARRTIS